MPEQLNAEQTEARRTLTAKKKNFTRQYHNVGKVTAFTTTNPSPDAAAQTKEAHKRLTKAYDEAMDALDEVAYLEPTNTSVEDNKDDIQKRFEEMEMRVLETLNDCARNQSDLTQAPQQGNHGNLRTKVNESLKPFKLAKEHTPVELRNWMRQFRSFFNTSNLETLSIEDQQAYFRICIDPALEEKLFPDIGATTPIFGQGGCLTLLEAEFYRNYPLAKRRTEYYDLKHEQGQAFSEFAAKLVRLGAEADLGSLEIADMHMFRYMQACNDQKLRDKFLELTEPTLAKLNAIIGNYESAKASSSAFDGRNAALKQIKSGSATHKSAQNPGPPQGQNKFQSQPQNQSTYRIPEQCACCGKKPAHPKRTDCPMYDAECRYCKRRGHIERMCRTKQRATARQQHQQQDRTAKVNQATYEDASSDEEATATINRVTSMYRVCNVTDKPTSDIEKLTSTNDTPRLKATFAINKKGHNRFEYDALPDSGCTRTVISYKIAGEKNLWILPTKDRLYAANGARLPIEGETFLWINGVQTNALVSSAINDIIISWQDLVKLDVLPADFPTPKPQRTTAKDEKVKQATTCSKDTQTIMTAITNKFGEVLTDELPPTPMRGTTMRIELDNTKEIKPRKVTTTKKIPVHWQAEAQKLVDSLLADGIIEEVHDNTSDWVSPAFFVPKSNGKLRLVTDFSYLNKFIKRPVHPFPSANDIMQNIPSNTKVFAKLDALQGYHQVPLDPESRHFTTFLLPMGKYRYKRGPMGLRSTSDVFCAKSDKTIHKVPGTQKIVDDILVCAPDYETLQERLEIILQRCKEQNIAISRKKLEIGEKINFAGFTLTPEGVTPDPEKTKALSDFPTPKNLTELRSFLGLANQLAGFVENMAITTDPLRALLKKGTEFMWTEDQDNAFKQTKDILQKTTCLQFFDPTLETLLLSDASNLHGLGFALVQKDKVGHLRMIQCGSRTLTDAETRYAPVELECLGIAWATEKCRHFLLGHPEYTVITDHNPLLGIFKKDIPSIDNRRLQRFRERLLPYSFKLIWQEGKKHLIADAFSRAPVDKPEPSDEIHVRYIAETPIDIIEDISTHCKEDAYKQILDALKQRKRARDLPPNHPAQEVQSSWDLLSTSEDGNLIIYDGSKIYIPHGARPAILKFLHKSHCGFTKMKTLAQQFYFWPRMCTAIKQKAESCRECLTFSPSLQKEPLTPLLADHPMQYMSADLFSWQGKNYLVLVDRFSGFPWVSQLKSLSTAAILSKLHAWFCDFGFPMSIRTDGGPQFRTEFHKYCKEHHIHKETSSAYFPESNGHAENAVKTAKHLLKKCHAHWGTFTDALLHWRNMPRADGISPAQMLFGFQQNFGLPTTSPPHYINRRKVRDARRRTMITSTKPSFDKTSKELEPLAVNTRVVVQDPKTSNWNPGFTIVSHTSDSRSYIVADEHGDCSKRNRRHVKPDSALLHSSKNASVDTRQCKDVPIKGKERRTQKG